MVFGMLSRIHRIWKKIYIDIKIDTRLVKSTLRRFLLINLIDHVKFIMIISMIKIKVTGNYDDQNLSKLFSI